VIINCEVKLDKDKATNKVYFDKKLKQFSNEVKRCGIMEDIRKLKCFYKPSKRRKINAQLAHTKWKYYS